MFSQHFQDFRKLKIECKPNYYTHDYYDRRHFGHNYPHYGHEYNLIHNEYPSHVKPHYSHYSQHQNNRNNNNGYRLPHPIERHSNGLPKDNTISYRTAGQRLTSSEELKTHYKRKPKKVKIETEEEEEEEEEPKSKKKSRKSQEEELPDNIRMYGSLDLGDLDSGLYDESNTYSYDFSTTTPSTTTTPPPKTKKPFISDKTKEWMGNKARDSAVKAAEKSAVVYNSLKEKYKAAKMKFKNKPKASKTPAPVVVTPPVIAAAPIAAPT
ncbi:unnamed protein product [Medioppia subpectinata]|uniref:Uncharacterized protein n=1 Tax=Medioppia subpectinata TaxID=1979941 RepID=A0A7R9L4Z3_9ACAR|nr:unnamed protein product [Medioppia subpectinata]CAG2115427.1 unnamed protein product [Medioppia subpectinata]